MQKAVLESMRAAEAKFDNLKELSHGPHTSHTVRASHSKKLENREAESDKFDTRALHGSNTSDTDRVRAQTSSQLLSSSLFQLTSGMNSHTRINLVL